MAIAVAEMTTALVPIGNSTNDIIVENDYFERDFAYQEADGSAISFATYVGACQIRDKAGNLIASPTVAALDSTGVVKLTLAIQPAAGTYDYDVEIVAGAVKRTIQLGPWQVSNEVTR